MSKDPRIDSLILGCTHYPLLLSKIRKHLPASVHIIPQGCYVARSLDDYLHRHPEIASRCTQGGTCRYLTTESPERFQETARMFLHEDVQVEHISLE